MAEEMKKIGGRSVTGKSKKLLVWVLFGLTILLLILMMMKPARGLKEAPLNMEVPAPDRKKMAEYDSLSVSKERSYAEEEKEKRQEKEEDAVPLNLEPVKPGEENEKGLWGGGGENVDSSDLEPSLKEQLRNSQREFYSPDTAGMNPQDDWYRYREPERRENFEYASPQRLHEARAEKEGFSSVSFDNRGLPVSQTIDGQTVQVKESAVDKEVKGNVLQNSGGDVFSDKQNITGSIMRNQEIYSGSLVKIRLEEAITINGVRVPANTIVTGRSGIKSSRIEISVPSIYVAGVLYDIGFQIYDQDGVIGLYIPDEVSIRQIRQENLKSSTNQALSEEVQQGTQDLATAQGKAGIIQRTGRTIASIVTNHRRPLKVYVPEGYKILLRPSCESCRN